ncbi:MAG TPA: TA system VapC family ribonuclease toxin [Acidobacteriota bacterium]|nr:TA system VapC family ribonuclease toxin [Acidobacteriota bacterium]
MTVLLDVNVLVALFDPAHIDHETCHRWFATQVDDGWASCPQTENGLVRVLANPKYPGRRTTIADAIGRLREFQSNTQHSFWEDSLSVGSPKWLRIQHIQGHRQLTDVYLLGLAVHRDAALATLDQRINIEAVKGARQRHLQLLK